MNELIESPQHSPLALYEAAVLALEKASTLAETMQVRDVSEFLKLQGKLAGDSEAIARAVALRMRSERKVGALLIDLKDRGQLRDGRPRKNEPDGTISLKDVGIDKFLSSSAQKLARYSLDEFETVIGRGLEKIRSGGAVVINPAKDLSTADKKLRRQVKAAQLALKQSKLPDDIFGVILADPEWPDETWSDNGKDRSPENHYPLSSIEEIAARPVGKMAAADCIIGLWITMRHLAIGSHLPILKEWGFEAKTVMIWDKVVAGNGRWVRNQVEALVIATRGNVPCPAPGTQWSDLISVPKSPVHSRKPDWAHEWFEEFYPGFKKIELNARRARPGWTVWGNEAPEGDEHPGDGSQGVEASVSAEETTARAVAAPAATDAIRQDDPVDTAGTKPRPLPPGRPLSVAAQPETGTGQSGAEGGGRGEPSSDVPPEPLSVDAQNAIIRQGYSHVPITPIAELMKLTGLTKDQIKKRAQKLEIASRDNQKGAVRVLMTKINEDRRAGA